MKKLIIYPFFMAVFQAVIVPAASGNSCEELAQLNLVNAKITLAESISPGKFYAPDGTAFDVPAFCRVRGISTPTAKSKINFEVWMPARDWNGRYYQHGQGGLGGVINYTALANLVNEGNAVAATDDGHIRDKDGGASWARDNQKVVDVFSLALKETFNNATETIKHFYNRLPQYRYFSGCSGGGRQAFIAAQRYPQDWDGILAGAPGNDTTGIYSAFSAYGQLWQNNPKGRIGPQKLPAIERAALSSCKKEAHVVNGIASDPRFCNFDPEILSCQGKETDDCLTRPQRDTLKVLYSGFTDKSTGKILYPGLAPTMETAGAWKDWVTGSDPNNAKPPLLVFLGNRFFRNFIYDNPDWNVSMFDIQRDPLFAKTKKLFDKNFSEIADLNETDLSELEASGTKLIVYNGWGDAGILPDDIIKYYEKVIEKAGGLKKTQNFFRLFMVPGMLHCKGGPGANSFGQMSGYTSSLFNDAQHNITRALESWVESGEAPERITATKYLDDNPKKGVLFTRPICAYPKVPAYKKSGSIDLAENFECIKWGTP